MPIEFAREACQGRVLPPFRIDRQDEGHLIPLALLQVGGPTPCVLQICARRAKARKRPSVGLATPNCVDWLRQNRDRTYSFGQRMFASPEARTPTPEPGT